MELGRFDYYLIAVNIIGFILYLINTWLYSHTAEGQIDTVLTITSLLGGSFGIILSILLFDRKAEKGNMMSRVFVSSVLVIQIILFLMIKGHIKRELTFAFWDFFESYKLLIVYLLVINIVTLILFAVDKIAAIEHRSRIRIVTLLGLAFIGGSVGALVAMYVFHHKTKQDYFSVGVPLIILMQVVVLFFLMNGKI